MTDRIGKLLERVALALQESNGVDDDESEASVFQRVLEETVGPLLRAGQAMRDRLDYDAALPRDIQAREVWDAALATLEGRE